MPSDPVWRVHAYVLRHDGAVGLSAPLAQSIPVAQGGGWQSPSGAMVRLLYEIRFVARRGWSHRTAWSHRHPWSVQVLVGADRVFTEADGSVTLVLLARVECPGRDAAYAILRHTPGGAPAFSLWTLRPMSAEPGPDPLLMTADEYRDVQDLVRTAVLDTHPESLGVAATGEWRIAAPPVAQWMPAPRAAPAATEDAAEGADGVFLHQVVLFDATATHTVLGPVLACLTRRQVLPLVPDLESLVDLRAIHQDLRGPWSTNALDSAFLRYGSTQAGTVTPRAGPPPIVARYEHQPSDRWCRGHVLWLPARSALVLLVARRYRPAPCIEWRLTARAFEDVLREAFRHVAGPKPAFEDLRLHGPAFAEPSPAPVVLPF